MRVGRPMLDVAAKQLVDELGTQLQGRLPGAGTSPTRSGPTSGSAGRWWAAPWAPRRTGGSPGGRYRDDDPLGGLDGPRT